MTSRLAIVAALLVALGAPALGQTSYLFPCDGGQEVPPVVTAATGTGLVVLDAAMMNISVNINHTVVGATMAHIHVGAAGTNGPVAINLGSPVSPIVGTFPVTPTDVANLMSGNWYVNIHTPANPGGEIRGQVVNSFPSAVFISEFCADPWSGTVGLDTNLDGTAATSSSQSNDEFVEIVNGTDVTVDISGWTVSDGFGLRHTFTAGTMLPPAAAITVFGGGDVTSYNATGRAGVLADTGSLGLNNGGSETITLADQTAVIIDNVMYMGASNGEADVRSPATAGSPFVSATTLPNGLAHTAGDYDGGNAVIMWPAATLPAPILPTFPGNGTDAETQIRVNGTVDTNPAGVVSIMATDVISMQFRSPGQSLLNARFAAIYQVTTTGMPPAGFTLPGDSAPALYLDFLSPFTFLADSIGNPGAIFAPALGFYEIVGTLPASLAGTSTSLLITLVVDDPGINFLNLGLADTKELAIQ